MGHQGALGWGHQSRWDGDPKAFGMGTPEWLGCGGFGCFGGFSHGCVLWMWPGGVETALCGSGCHAALHRCVPPFGAAEAPSPCAPHRAPTHGPELPPLPHGVPQHLPSPQAELPPLPPRPQPGDEDTQKLQQGPTDLWGFFCTFPPSFPFFQPILSPFLSLSFSSSPLARLHRCFHICRATLVGKRKSSLTIIHSAPCNLGRL